MIRIIDCVDDLGLRVNSSDQVEVCELYLHQRRILSTAEEILQLFLLHSQIRRGIEYLGCVRQPFQRILKCLIMDNPDYEGDRHGYGPRNGTFRPRPIVLSSHWIL